MTTSFEQASNASEWASWIRALGKHIRHVREFLGLSQDQLARLSGVSQGAVSRLEAGRGLATPMLVVMRIVSAMRRVVTTIDPDLLSEDARRLLAIDPPYAPRFMPVAVEMRPILGDPALEEIIRLYRALPERSRDKVLAVVRVTVSALTGLDGSPAATPPRTPPRRRMAR